MALTAKQLKDLSAEIFKKHEPMMSLYQTLADHFYPERADFTETRNIGTELADMLVESYPILVRRDLGDSLSAMLRDGDWFNIGISGEPDEDGKLWLQWATGRLKRLMGKRSANFTRATKEGDHDFVTFGSTVISVEVNKKASGLLYRAWHLRDCSWFDDETGQVAGVVRKWKPSLTEMVSYFGDAVHKNITEQVKDTPFKEGDVRHLVIPSSMYGDKTITEQFPYVSCFIDIVNDHIIEMKGVNNKQYVVPRFKTIPGHPFAYSPATVIGLPDARSVQQMQHTLLEAAERYTRPPIIATAKVIRGDVDLSADGITWVDDEYDERLGAALRPIAQDRGGFPIGLEMKSNIIETLRSAFYANKISLPDTDRDMTAYEFSERMKQYRRENLPLFEPIETEYNGQLCELSFEVAQAAGFLGSPQDIPESLQDRNVVFTFISPLTVTEEEKTATQFDQVVAMTTRAKELDPNVVMNVNLDASLRDAMTGTGAPEHWKRAEEEVEQGRKAAAAAQMAQLAGEQQQLAQSA